ncbi:MULTISPECIES: WGR domain-containing protein [Brucella/Ochrobactrum group]|uniref:DNA-binding WGR domain protein n=5 Tax=Brucella TaxID=234 RepID=A0A5C5CDC7_9HYPH|nr:MULTISPECIES: WGR domain-containing protein [Brucella/Ochrobactrum group]MCR5944195.1 WGR domain-containing protein [Ochrobactrum sp. XJ1]NVM43019.1 WGR domain-containing protein [Brucella intermedia]KAB2673724.1 WGR domain-containing protein [Brucella tritici]KAB2739862.1 WGR domain-containing protein [Brucella anthropi]KAB2756688.1 WGR domain-containing protein [Brucella anthropi]
MSNQNSFPIHFRKIQPHNNMRRFYTLSVQPNLFGEWCVMRSWGRIGTLGQSVQQTVLDEASATTLLHRLVAVRHKRGYEEVP